MLRHARIPPHASQVSSSSSGLPVSTGAAEDALEAGALVAVTNVVEAEELDTATAAADVAATATTGDEVALLVAVALAVAMAAVLPDPVPQVATAPPGAVYVEILKP